MTRSTRKPAVRNGLLISNQGGRQQPAPIALDGEQWQAWQQWLMHNTMFVFYGEAGHFTAQREVRRGHAYWYGYRRRSGKLHKVYLGRPEDLRLARLEEANAALAGKSEALPAVLLTPFHPPGIEPTRLDWDRLAPPALPHKLVERRRLTQRISAPLTLVYAPGGFGKSTLLSAWRRQCPVPVAWVTLTEEENQPIRFWMLLVSALQRALAQTVDLAPYLQADEDALPKLLVQLNNQLAQCAGSAAALHLAIVLDDYHLIRNPAINTLLQRWLERWSPALQLILAGHIRPPLAVGALRARGLVAELDADDLRFTLEEGVQFLQTHQPAGAILAQHEMETLVQRTKGWASGLLLAALALAKQPDPHAFLASFNGSHIYLREYFLQDVFERQSVGVQQFLLQTAILRQLNGSLCDAVTGRTDSADLLAWLWRENLFLVQLEQEGVYQYHTLFGEVLAGELQRRMPRAKADLHRRAAEWYRRQRAIDDAVYHLLAIEAWEEAAALIEEIAVRELAEFGEDSRLLRWLRQLPAAVVQQHKTLLFLYVRLARIGLSAQEVQRFLADVEERIRAHPPGERSADEDEVLAELEQMRTTSSWASSSGRYAAVWQLLGGLDAAVHAASAGQDEAASDLSLAVYEAALQEDNLFVLLMAGGNCTAGALLRGELRRGRQFGEEVLARALARRGVLPEPASITLHALAWIALERNETDRCEDLLARARVVDPNPTSTNMPISLAVLAARLHTARGETDAAQAALHAARALHARHPPALWKEEDLVAYQAWFALRSGDPALAQTLLHRGGGQPHALSELVAADLLLTQGEARAATAALQTLLRQYPLHLPREPHIRTRLLLALALFAQEEAREARQLLATIVRGAAPEGYVRPFLDYGVQLTPLLNLLLQQENFGAETRQFVRQLRMQIVRFLPTDSLLREAGEGNGPLAVAASITPREQEVLRLLAAGHTNAEIARSLSIAESTVKTHLVHLYAKLRVTNRVEAVAWLSALPA